MFAVYMHQGANVAPTLTLAVVILAAAIAGLVYRRELVPLARVRPRVATVALAVLLAFALIVRTDALTPVPACMGEELNWYCRLLDWLY